MVLSGIKWDVLLEALSKSSIRSWRSRGSVWHHVGYVAGGVVLSSIRSWRSRGSVWHQVGYVAGGVVFSSIRSWRSRGSVWHQVGYVAGGVVQEFNPELEVTWFCLASSGICCWRRCPRAQSIAGGHVVLSGIKWDMLLEALSSVQSGAGGHVVLSGIKRDMLLEALSKCSIRSWRSRGSVWH